MKSAQILPMRILQFAMQRIPRGFGAVMGDMSLNSVWFLHGIRVSD